MISTKDFPKFSDSSGSLTFIEGENHIPFTISRVYYVYDVAENALRGHHAHKQLEQYLMCVHGSCSVWMDNGKSKEKIRLDSPSTGLYVGPSIWHVMEDFSPGAVLLVLASAPYDESDYIRDYEEFLRYVKEKDV